jgi:putative DNA primase/helicase
MPNFHPENIPPEMKDLPQWVLWKLEQVIDADTGYPKKDPLTGETKLTKVPYQPNGKKADSTKSSTWSPYEVVFSTYDPSVYAGLGFVLTKEAGFIAVDFDHVLHDWTLVDGCEMKRWDEGVYAEISDFNSYAELSQSGEGAHVFCKGTLPKAGRKKGNREMYSDNRFFAVTGDHIPRTPRTVNESQECVKDYYDI